MNNPTKILVIDDDRMYSKLLSMVLVEDGYEVITAEDGVQGLRLAANEHPDLILLDHHLPAADGLTVLLRLQGNASTRNIPVIYLTGSESKTVAKEALDQGVLAVFEKGPLDVRSFRSYINRILETAEPSEEKTAATEHPQGDNPLDSHAETHDSWGSSE